jgi:hypothetical protein
VAICIYRENGTLKTLMGNGTFELKYGTAESRTSRAADTLEKGQSARAMQQRIQPKRDIANIASWISYSK